MAETIGLVLARAGSRGVPGKNLRRLGGTPLVGRAIETLRGAPGIDRVLLSTEDPEIAAVGRDFGAETPFLRPAELATDDSPAIDSVAHAARRVAEFGEAAARLVLLQATAPFTTSEDVAAALEQFAESDARHLVSVTRVEEHPHWMATLDGDRLEFLFDAATRARRRQDLPPTYRLNGAIYIYDGASLLEGEPTKIDWGGIAAYVMPAERSVDIDTEADWDRAEELA